MITIAHSVAEVQTIGTFLTPLDPQKWITAANAKEAERSSAKSHAVEGSER